MFINPLSERMAAFVRSIGIEVHAAALVADTSLPGLDIRHGAIMVDEEKVSHPGDLLHEAGHIGVAPPERRAAPALSPSEGDELATLAWSYAAACHLDLDPAVVFHPYGYKGGAQVLIDVFTGGGTPGVPLLQWYGMTAGPDAAACGVGPYPHMLGWLC